ncbi:hypothetical protein AB0I39_39360 [Kitasatospora purpeofusca]|uniref:hypothetical protein n=1 Tax=Kitasatospora purpeofusca TaxID=67352 RepID=UPI0033C92E28
MTGPTNDADEPVRDPRDHRDPRDPPVRTETPESWMTGEGGPPPEDDGDKGPEDGPEYAGTDRGGPRDRAGTSDQDSEPDSEPEPDEPPD